MESKLKNQLAECQKLQERADRLQRNLDDTLQWKTDLETTFSIRENDLERKVKQLEDDLRSTADIKLQLQNQISEISNREATIADVREAVDRLDQKNKNLTEQLSNSNGRSAPKAEQSKILFLEEQINKLEQQLDRSRENLTLEREKSRRIQNELDKKEKELNDAKIDLRIAKRETNSAESESAKLKEDAKQLREKLKVGTNFFVKSFFQNNFSVSGQRRRTAGDENRMEESER